MKKILSGIIAVFALLIMVGSASAVGSWFQGFETDTEGWFDVSNSGYGYLTQVPSGTDGISSADGSFHAIAKGDGSSAPFSRFTGYSDTWPGKWASTIDVYLNPSWPLGTGFDYSVASSKSDGSHLRDFIFHVTKDTSTGNLLVAGSNNTNFAPIENLETGNHYVVSSAGWYTLQHIFRDQGGALAVDLNLLDSNGNVVFTETRYNAADTIPGLVGGNRYSWFTFINVNEGIAIDNHELYTVPPMIIASVNGGGQILEEKGNKKKNWLKVSFGGNVEEYDDGSLTGEFQVNLHNVGNDEFDKSKFHGTEITDVNFFDGNSSTCNDAVNFTVNGTFNNNPASMVFRAGDLGSPNTADTARVTIFSDLNGKGSILYDTHANGEFADESSCVGTARTGLDNGNITINR